MMDGSYTLGGAADFTMKLFKVGTGERPDLALTGVPVIDNATGGLFPGTLVVIGAREGTGKSFIVLDALMNTPEKVGAIFLEDSPDMVGSRALAYHSGVNSNKLRFAHKLQPGHVKRLQAAQEELAARDNVHLKFILGGSIEEVETAVDELGEAGCKVVFLDYAQKIHGAVDSRRSEIDRIMVRYQKRCLAIGAVPVLVSQLSRQAPTEKVPHPEFMEPHISKLKESSGLEQEARVLVMLWKEKNGSGVNARLSKCSFGGEAALDFYVREQCGSLKSKNVCSEWETV